MIVDQVPEELHSSDCAENFLSCHNFWNDVLVERLGDSLQVKLLLVREVAGDHDEAVAAQLREVKKHK